MLCRQQNPYHRPRSRLPAPVGEPPAPRPLFLRKPAIILFVVGLLIVIAGFANFVPGGARSGGAVCFWGVLLFAFSFIRLPKTGPDAPPPMSALQRIAGVFYEPANVFRNLRSHPRWLAGLLLIASLNIAYSVAFTQRLTPERIVNYMADKMAQTPWIPPEAVERQREEGLEQAKNPVQRVGTAIASVVGTFAFMSLMGALYMLGVLVFGGRINFWQSLCAHHLCSGANRRYSETHQSTVALHQGRGRHSPHHGPGVTRAGQPGSALFTC